MDKVCLSNIAYFLGFVLLLGSSLTADGAPPSAPESEKPPQISGEETVYDQRQNGTENVRVQLSGLTLVVAPAEALLGLELPQGNIGMPVRSNGPSQKSNASKSKLVNMLMGFLHSNHHQEEQ